MSHLYIIIAVTLIPVAFYNNDFIITKSFAETPLLLYN